MIFSCSKTFTYLLCSVESKPSLLALGVLCRSCVKIHFIPLSFIHLHLPNRTYAYFFLFDPHFPGFCSIRFIYCECFLFPYSIIWYISSCDDTSFIGFLQIPRWKWPFSFENTESIVFKLLPYFPPSALYHPQLEGSTFEFSYTLFSTFHVFWIAYHGNMVSYTYMWKHKWLPIYKLVFIYFCLFVCFFGPFAVRSVPIKKITLFIFNLSSST